MSNNLNPHKYLYKSLLLALFLTPSLEVLSTGDKCNSTALSSQAPICPYLHICHDQICLHKFIWPPATEEILGSILLFIVVGLGTAGGIGGVFLIRPILVYLFNYSVEASSQVSYAVLFGGMFGGCLQRIWKREPGEKPAIHYEVVLVAVPLLMFGANLGTLLNRVMPSIVDLIIQLYLLITTVQIMWRNHKKLKEDSKKKIEHPEILGKCT